MRKKKLNFMLGLILIILLFLIFKGHGNSNIFSSINNQMNNLIEPQVPKNIEIYYAKANPPTETKTIDNIIEDGTSLPVAIESDEAINKMADEITKGDTTNLEKAEAIYKWIAYNINYDQKEDTALSNGATLPPGEISAINTFKNRESVCAGFAELFEAMMIHEKIPVRLVAGKGYSGTFWGNHMWNQVYIKSLGGWINVDTTFASSFAESEKEDNIALDPYGIFVNKTAVYTSENGNQWKISPADYFGSQNFSQSHKDGEILSQWA